VEITIAIKDEIFGLIKLADEENGARYRDRTCDPYHVKVVLYR
jgi:hypothetical protein